MSLIAGNLGIMQRLLDEHHIHWGIYAGSAAHIYGNRRPIKNVDVLVAPGSLKPVSQLMKEAKRIAQFDGRRIMWSGIVLCEDLSVRRNGANYPFKLDNAMIEHLRKMQLLGSHIKMLSPEDIIIHKLLMGRTGDDGQKDLSDAVAIVSRQQLDKQYMQERLRLSNSTQLLKPQLEGLGIVFP